MKEAKQQFDIAINGQMGFYTIIVESTKGKRWSKRIQGFDGHAAYCDDTRMTEDIADGAFDAGLRVSVNGRRYVGNGKVAA
jgi:hypothetical protein